MIKFLFSILSFCIFFPIKAQTPYSKELEKLAKGGDVQAILDLGDAYLNGYNVKKNPNEAVKWYEKATKLDSEVAYEKLIACYESWDAVEKNPKKAKKWIEKGARAGIPSILFKYGFQSLKDGNSYLAAKNFVKSADKGYKTAVAYAGYALATNNTPDYPLAFFYANKALKRNDISEEEKNLANGAAALALIEMGRDKSVWLPYFENTYDPKVLLKIAMKIPPKWSQQDLLSMESKMVEYYKGLLIKTTEDPIWDIDRKVILEKLPESSKEYYWVKAMQDYEDQNYQMAFQNICRAADMRDPLASIIMSSAYLINDKVASNFAQLNNRWGENYIFDNLWLNFLSRMAIEKFRNPNADKLNTYLYYSDILSNPQCVLSSIYHIPAPYYSDNDHIAVLEKLKNILSRSKMAVKHGKTYFNRFNNTWNPRNTSVKSAYEDFLKEYETYREKLCPTKDIDIADFFINQGLDLYKFGKESNDPEIQKETYAKATDYILTPLAIFPQDVNNKMYCIGYLIYPNPKLALQILNETIERNSEEIASYFSTSSGDETIKHLYQGDKYSTIEFYRSILQKNISSDTKTKLRRHVYDSYNEAI